MKRPSGFTVLELLVVIALITVVAAVLLPVITRARSRGTEGACISNLRQLGMAFRMYMQDFDEARPHQLYSLVPTYVSSPALLVCKSDSSGNYAYKSWGYIGSPGLWPYPQSYDYFQPNDTWWAAIDGRGPRSGYLFDRCHGEARGKAVADGVHYYIGHTLRVNMDGSVVSREIHYPSQDTNFDSWYLMNYNPGEPVPPHPK